MPGISELLQHYQLTPDQAAAVLCTDPVVLVTAGAGCGKTRTLVGRYLWAVEQGTPPRRMVAITFTEKAAREMRNRVRSSIREVSERNGAGAVQERWLEAAAQMDSARIGTIHSLCAELLRSHPVEAKVDPEFAILDEGLAAALREAVVRDSTAWAAEERGVVSLFEVLSPAKLAEILNGLLSRRLDMGDPVFKSAGPLVQDVVGGALGSFLEHPSVMQAIAGMEELKLAGRLPGDAGDKLAGQLEALLEAWEQLGGWLKSGRVIDAAGELFSTRRNLMALNVGRKSSEAKQLLTQLREIYEARLQPWLGGGNSTDPLPDEALEERIPGDVSSLKRIFEHSLEHFLQELDRQRALDFDALEAGALEVLQNPRIRSRWQEKFDLVLVDEFQDTNGRQRDLLEALTGGSNTRLFVVGDARQSIYRFRGADVTVFLGLEREVYGNQGSSITLNATFRSHNRLLRTLDVLVGRPMNAEAGDDTQYRVPYTALESMRPEDDGESPSVSIVLGRGSIAQDARPAAADALAVHLLEMKQKGRFADWEDVALLFRASTGFTAYEEALEARGIPYITIAGRGFYERPEIRDVLNLLKALASPWDDAAMAGLLRSPAVGMSDVGLFQLRRGTDVGMTLYAALSQVETLSPEDELAGRRALSFLETFLPAVDRDQVAVLLKAALDYLDYRPLLASSGARLWRNLDKLVEDARASGMVRVRSFLDYVRTLRDVGVREGEAPARADGALRLMTIHKAKGLEFPVVVLADASRKPGGRGNPFYLMPETGLTFQVEGTDSQPLLYKLAKSIEKQADDAEELRLLYVAATRARERLIISGFLRQAQYGWSAEGWTKVFLDQCGLDARQLGEQPVRECIQLENQEQVEIWVVPDSLPELSHRVVQDKIGVDEKRVPLLEPLSVEKEDTADDDDPEHDWRATGQAYPPAAAVGSMVHAALRSWLFPGDDGLDAVLEAAAFENRLLHPRQRQEAVKKAERLLERFRAHGLWQQVAAADERLLEVPYTLARLGSRGLDTGRIDLLFRKDESWYVVDYKTDELRDEEQIREAVNQHRPQLERYRQAVCSLLHSEPVVLLCFLDAVDEVRVERI